MTNERTTWVLVDHRLGNSTQGLALALLLGLKYEQKYLEYNVISTLPNFVKCGFIELTKKNKNELVTTKEIPDIIISSGRRMASVAVAIKRLYPSCKIIQIMNPGVSLKYFDVIVLPEHDKKPSKRYISKSIFITGALTYYPPETLNKDIEKWEETLGTNKFPKPVITVLIGGKSKGCNLTVEFIQSLFLKLQIVAQKLNASVFISTSRRTPRVVMNYIKNNISSYITQPYFLYDFTSKTNNPYRGFLAFSDFIIVTGDSISMCSEAINSGKPTYIAYDKALISNKHLRYINSVFSANYARSFSEEFEYYKPDINRSFVKEQILKLIGIYEGDK